MTCKDLNFKAFTDDISPPKQSKSKNLYMIYLFFQLYCGTAQFSSSIILFVVDLMGMRLLSTFAVGVDGILILLALMSN
jgi:hypothetical protein